MINDVLEKMSMASRFIDGLRVTDSDTMDVVQMVMAGKINTFLVSLIQKIGGKAVGLSGIDGRMIEAERINEELGFAGNIIRVNPDLILDSLDNGYIPVISTLGFDDDGHIYNINSDTAAAQIAASLKAERFIVMTNVKGLYQDFSDENSFIDKINVSDIRKLMETGSISAGMIPKLKCCIEAVESGVKKTVIINGTMERSVLVEMFTDEGIGTLIEA